MAIIVREVSDDDLPRTCEIEGTAFADNPLSSVLFPGPFAPEGDQKRVADLIEQRKADPKMKYIQAYDEETKQLIAFSKWNIYDTTEAATAKRPSRNFGPGSNAPACEAFFGGLAKKKEEIMGGKPHIYLHILVTDPAFQGKGAGGLLLKWGIEKADELGLPIYLESSAVAHGFYQRHGFKDHSVFTIDLSPYGGQGIKEEPLMIREPKSLS